MHDQSIIDDLKRTLEETLGALRREVHDELNAQDPLRYAELRGLMSEGVDIRVAERAHEFGLESIRRHLAEMHDLEAALERIRNGHYGSCVHCAELIPVPRLNAQPAAARCVSCQSNFEAAGST